MIDNKVEMSLLTSNKTGILSSIMMQGSNAGLIYHKHQLDKLDDSQSRLNIVFEGYLNCSVSELVDAIEAHTEVQSIESMSIGSEVTNQTSSISNTEFATLRAHYVITPESLQVAEEKLFEILGVSASILVNSAAEKTKHIGDMFILLYKELKGEQRKKFLSLVTDLNPDQLK